MLSSQLPQPLLVPLLHSLHDLLQSSLFDLQSLLHEFAMASLHPKSFLLLQLQLLLLVSLIEGSVDLKPVLLLLSKHLPVHLLQ